MMTIVLLTAAGIGGLLGLAAVAGYWSDSARQARLHRRRWRELASVVQDVYAVADGARDVDPVAQVIVDTLAPVILSQGLPVTRAKGIMP